MRLVVACLFFLLTHLASATDALILISQKDAGPGVPAAAYIHPTWVLWPPASNEAGTNLLMSIPSGMDWRAEPGDDLFDVNLLPVNLNSLTTRGYFDATRMNIRMQIPFPVAARDGSLALPTLRAGLVIPIKLDALSFTGPLKGNVIVTTVHGPRAWDDMADIARRAGGRVLVVELPEPNQPPWTRMWLKGKGWPEGEIPLVASTGIPGLLPAREILGFLRTGGDKWQPNDTYRWGGANRWLEHGYFTVPVFMVFVGVVAIYVAGLAVYCIIREEKGRLAQFLLRLLILGPAILVLGGRWASRGMVTDWPFWLIASVVVLAVVSFGVNWVIAKLFPSAHALFGEMLVGLLVCLGIDPSFSVFGNALGAHFVQNCPEVYGAICAYAIGFLYFLKRGFWALLIQGGLLGAGIYFLAQPWMARGFSAFGQVTHGFTYAANDLYTTRDASQALNVADHVALVSSPAFIGFTLFVLIVWIAGDKFLSHQIRRALSFNRQPLAFAWSSGAFFLVGLAAPVYLYAALACAMAGVTAVLFDAVRAP